MAKRRDADLVRGNLWSGILMFALPLAASSILQQLFNSADVAVVGQFAGSRALAAVGSNAAVINLLVNIFMGLSIGANVVIARYVGEGNKSKVERAVHTAVAVSLISGVIVTVLGIVVSRPILEMISTPDDIIDLASVYLKIYFLGMPFMMLYNFGAAILRSVGDTRRPFICLLVSGIINVVLNLFFVIVCRLSVAGVAIATVTSNIVSSGLVLWFLMRERSDIRVDLKKLRIDKRILKEIARIGLPAGVQGVVFSFSNICVQSAVNSLGSDVVAGSAAALNFEYFVYFMLNAFSQACVTFTSQNYGAGEYARCRKIARLCTLMGFLASGAMCAAFLILGRHALRLYTNEEAVMATGIVRMRYCLLFPFTSVLMDTLSGSMRGLGYSLTPAIISLAGSCGLRLVWVYLIFPLNPTFDMLLTVYPATWAVTSAAMFAAYMFVSRHMLKRRGMYAETAV